MKQPGRQSLNWETPSRTHDIELNYYMRSTGSKKRKLPPAQLKGMNTAVYWFPGQNTTHPGLHANYAPYALLAYMSAIVVCSLVQIRDNNKKAKTKELPEECSSEIQSFDANKPNIEFEQLIGSSPNPRYFWSRPPDSGLFANVLSSFSLPEGNVEESHVFQIQETEEVNRKDDCQWALISEEDFDGTEALSKSVPFLTAALFRLWSHPAKKSSTTPDNTAEYSQCSTEVVKHVATKKIGSSLEDNWDENSPLVNPRVPSQLRSLLAIPELCV